jgi:hypothetical protein
MESEGLSYLREGPSATGGEASSHSPFLPFFFFQPDALADSDKEKMTTKTTIFSIITRIDLLNFIMSTERPQ